MQTFEKGGANLRVFTKGGANHKKILILRPKLEGVNSVSGEKLHDFEIICAQLAGCECTPPPPPLRIGLGSPDIFCIKEAIPLSVFFSQ